MTAAKKTTQSSETLASVKDALPSTEDVQTFVKDNAADVQQFADTATDYVRRNPGTSIAAAAGVGVIIGLLMTKRS